MIIHVKPLAILVSALLSLNVTFANTPDSSQPTINQQQENTIGVQYALHNGKFYIKVNGLAFENVQDFILNGEPITNKILELVTNQLATVLKENNAFTISFNLPKETNFSGMTFGIISGNQIYSSEMPAAVFAQDSIQTFDSVVSISDFNQIGNTRRAIVAQTPLTNTTTPNNLWTTQSNNSTIGNKLWLQSSPITGQGQTQAFDTIINSGNAGKVGVGTATPSAKLDVNGAIKISSSEGFDAFKFGKGLLIAYNPSNQNSEISSLNLTEYYGGNPKTWGYTPLVLNGSKVSIAEQPLSGGLAMIPGNVGIGLKEGTDPKAKLDVRGMFLVSPAPLSMPSEGLHMFYTTKELTPQVTVPTAEIGAYSPSGYQKLTITGNPLILNDSDLGNTRNVGIGTTNPTAKLEIGGGPGWTSNNWQKAIKLNNGNAIQFGTTGTQFGIGASSDGDKLYLFTTSTNQQTAGANYAMTVSNNGFVSFPRGHASDRRWKTEIKPIDSALDKVGKMQGVSYRWNKETFQDADDKTHIGFIAQEVESVLPELVTTGSDGFKGVEYDKVTAVLVEALKELKAQNDALKAVICETNPTKPICQTK